MSKEFLYTLLDSMSVSGHEIPLQKKVIAEMTPHCDKIITDYTGNVVCVLNPDAPFKVMLAAHIDEIGLIVTHIQPDGLLRVSKSGGIFPGVYPGHQVAVHGYAQTVYGAVVRSKDMDKADLKADELYIDIGAKDAADARKYVQEGDPVHMNTYHQEMINGFLSARGIDDRGCAYIILEALKRAKAMDCSVGVYAATTVGEETTGRGSYWVGSAIRPDVAIVTDVTFASDYPGVDAKQSGEVKLGCGGVLCNSSIGSRKVNDLLKAVAKEHNIPIRVGVNSGSLEKELVEKYHGVTAEGIVESALDKVHMIEEEGYENMVISIKSSDVLMCVRAHEILSQKTDYPLHVGITEAGTIISGNIKSSIGLGLILHQGIGDTIRVSLTGDPVEEIKSAKIILRTLGLRKGGIEVVSCPTCGRTKIDLIGLANQVETMVAEFPLNIKVAVMGCAVNGPGEAKEADLGIAGGIHEGLLIKKGEIIRKVPEDQLLSVLREELEHWES